MQLGAVHDLVGQAVELARPERALEDRAAFGGPASTLPVMCSSCSSGQTLELAPQLVGPPQQRHVGGMLPVGEPDDSGESVGGAVLVDQVEALQPEHSEAPAGEVVQRRTPHPSQTQHDHVVGQSSSRVRVPGRNNA